MFRKLIIDTTLILELDKSKKYVKKDPDDDKFIQSAVSGKANYIISQDRHLLVLKKLEGIKILTLLEHFKN